METDQGLGRGEGAETRELSAVMEMFCPETAGGLHGVATCLNWTDKICTFPCMQILP